MNYIEKYKEMEKLFPTTTLLDFIYNEFGLEAVNELLMNPICEITIAEALACKYGEDKFKQYLPKDEEECYKLTEYGWSLSDGFKLVNLYEFY